MSTKKWFPFAPPASVSRPKEVPIAIAIASVEKTALMEDSSLVKVQSRSEMSALKMSETMALLLIPTPEASPLLLHFSGHGHLTLLKGECEVHGFQLGLGDRREVTCPSWMPSYPILCSKGKKIRKGLFPMTLPCLQDKELIASLSSYDVVLCLEGEEVSKLEWLVRVDVGQDQIRALEVAHASGEVLSCDFIALRSLLLYKSNTFSAPSTLPESLDLESLIIPGSWSTAIKTVCAAPPYSSPRTLFCGAKGVGKSTCLRQTINALLSKRRGVKYAAVIDCDIGQPEFSLPGFVSLTMLNTDSPRLVPPHLSLVSPTLQFFLGDVTNKNEPQFLPSALRQCFLRYEELKAEIEEHGDLEAVASRTKLKNGGQFAPLLSKERGELPLLINTDGWIKGMGLEVLFEVIRATQPSFILHLTSPRNADLPALSVAPENAVIITLETGRDVPSRVLSADLRLLRFTSYFLRHTSFTSIDGLALRSGAFLDPNGVLSSALCCSRSVTVPFTDVCLSLFSPPSPQLLLATFNVSFVAIVCHSESATSYSYSQNAENETHYSLQLRKGDVFSIRSRNPPPVLPSVGLCIVRAVDIDSKCFHLLLPSLSCIAAPPSCLSASIFLSKNTTLPLCYERGSGRRQQYHESKDECEAALAFFKLVQ